MNEELLLARGDLYPLGADAGIADSAPGAGLPSPAPAAMVAQLPPVVLSPENALKKQMGNNGWISVDFEWNNPTAFAALANTKYSFLEGTVPANFRFILKRIESVIPFDTSSVDAYDVTPAFNLMAHSSADSYLVFTANGAVVAQGLDALDSEGVGASFKYAPTVFDLIEGVNVFKVFEENINLAVFSYVTFPSYDAFATNSVGVKTRISGILIPKVA